MKSLILTIAFTTSLIYGTASNALVVDTAMIIKGGKIGAISGGIHASAVIGLGYYAFKGSELMWGSSRAQKIILFSTLILMDDNSSNIQEDLENSLEDKYTTIPRSVLAELSEKILKELKIAVKNAQNSTRFNVKLEKDYVSNLVNDTNASDEDKIGIIKALTE